MFQSIKTIRRFKNASDVYQLNGDNSYPLLTENGSILIVKNALLQTEMTKFIKYSNFSSSTIYKKQE